jgi:hypothetical protein
LIGTGPRPTQWRRSSPHLRPGTGAGARVGVALVGGTIERFIGGQLAEGIAEGARHHRVDRRKRSTGTRISLNPASGCDLGPYPKSHRVVPPGPWPAGRTGNRRSARSRIAWVNDGNERLIQRGDLVQQRGSSSVDQPSAVSIRRTRRTDPAPSWREPRGSNGVAHGWVLAMSSSGQVQMSDGT